MLTKLIKYECKTTWAVLWPVAVGVAALSTLAALLNCAATRIAVLQNSTIFFVVHMAVAFLSALGLFAAMVACGFVLIHRFYRLLGEEGYLMLTLPATPFAHIAAKLTCALLTTVMATALAFLCGGLLASGDGYFYADFSGSAFLESIPAFLYVGLLMLLLGAGAFLFIYLCIALAGHWPQQRLLASIVLYFVLTFVLQVVALILVVTVALGFASQVQNGGWVYLMEHNINTGNAQALAYAMLAGFALLCAGVDAILWAVTQHLMTKQLNLP